MNLDEQKKLEWYKHKIAHLGRMAEFTHAFELTSLRYLFLLNGGAEIAFLTLLGTDVGNYFDLRPAVLAILLWAGGLYFAMKAARQMYFSQFNFYKARSREVDEIRNWEAGHTKGAQENVEDQARYYALAETHRDRGHGCTELSVGLFGGGVSFAVISYIAAFGSAPN